MSAPALSMLLIALAEEGADGRELWWSTDRFPTQYGISPTTRAKGTRELVGRRLLYVHKRLVTSSPNRSRTFSRERVRNVYQLINDATISKPLPLPNDPWATPTPAASPRPRPRKKKVLTSSEITEKLNAAGPRSR
jgi:hypothetical protein